MTLNHLTVEFVQQGIIFFEMRVGIITANERNIRSSFNLDLLVYYDDRAHPNTIFLSQGGMV